MSIFNLIKDEHKRIDSLLRQLEETGEDQPLEREKLFEKLKESLSGFLKFEQKTVYEALKEREKARRLCLLGMEEHQLMSGILEELSLLSPAKETWTAKLQMLRDFFKVYRENEKEGLFKRMKKGLKNNDLKNMATALKNLSLIKQKQSFVDNEI